MSASEKLKALEAASTADDTYPWHRYEAEKLRNALPQIVAVVEAAEAEVANAQLVCDEEILLDRALAPLDEALK